MEFKDLDHFRNLFKVVNELPYTTFTHVLNEFKFWDDSGEQTYYNQCTNMTFYSKGLYGGVIDIFPYKILIRYDNFEDIEHKELNSIEMMEIDTSFFVNVTEEEIFQASTTQNFDFLENNLDVLKQIIQYSLVLRSNRNELWEHLSTQN